MEGEAALGAERTPRPRYWKCDCDGLAQESDPQGHREGPREALFYPEILHHHLTPVIGKEKVNCKEPGSNKLNPARGNLLKACSVRTGRCLYEILYLKEKGVGGGREILCWPSPALFRGVFTHLWACQCDVVSALLKAMHLTFKPSNGLGPPEDPSVPRLTFRRGAPTLLRLLGGRCHLQCSGLLPTGLPTKVLSSSGRISAF